MSWCTSRRGGTTRSPYSTRCARLRVAYCRPRVLRTVFGQRLLNLFCFVEHLLSAGKIVLPGDSLVAPTTILASCAREVSQGSQSPSQAPFSPQVSHELGVGNQVDKMLSRGRVAEALEATYHLCLDPVCVEVPETAIAFLDNIFAFWRSLTLEERATPWMHEPGGRGRRPRGGGGGKRGSSHDPAEGFGARHSRPSRSGQDCDITAIRAHNYLTHIYEDMRPLLWRVQVSARSSGRKHGGQRAHRPRGGSTRGARER